MIMTWDEYFRAMRQGDIGCISAFAVECAIMSSPIWGAALIIWICG